MKWKTGGMETEAKGHRFGMHVKEKLQTFPGVLQCLFFPSSFQHPETGQVENTKYTAARWRQRVTSTCSINAAVFVMFDLQPECLVDITKGGGFTWLIKL